MDLSFPLSSKHTKEFDKLLADKQSLSIITLLRNETRSIDEIADKLKLKQSLIKRHLKKLDEIGLLTVENRVYWLSDRMVKYYKKLLHDTKSIN